MFDVRRSTALIDRLEPNGVPSTTVRRRVASARWHVPRTKRRRAESERARKRCAPAHDVRRSCACSGGSRAPTPHRSHAAGGQALDVRIEARNDAGVEIVLLLVCAEPEHAVLAAAEKVAADLIIAGTEGRRNLARVFIGSVAAGVVRAAGVPVMTVHA